ncbi:MAG: PAS domain S-box protein [Cyclobacteriaceae bacterium]
MNFNLTAMPFRLFIVSLFLVASIFLLELVMPFHASVTLGYVIIIFYMLQFPQQSKYAIVLGIVTTIFIVLGYFLTAHSFKDQPSVPLNRALSVLAIWMAVYFSLRFKELLDTEVKHKEQLNAVFNNATEGMLIVNKGGSIVLVNAFAEQLFGYRHEELLGMNIENLLPDHLRVAHHDHRKAFMAKPETRPMGKARELFARRKDGMEFPVEISLSHFKNEQGSFAIAFVLDLTERQKALKALNQEQKLVQTYFELAPILFIVLDKTGSVTGVNDHACQLLGYKKEEMLGKNWFETFLTPEMTTKREFLANIEKIFEGKSVLLEYENPVLNKNDEEIDISWRNSIIHDMQGQPIALLAAGTDITERKKHERAISAHHEAIRNLNEELEVKIRKRTTELHETVHQLEAVNRQLIINQRLFKAITHYFPDSAIGVLNKDLKYLFVDGQELRNIGLTKDDNRGDRVFDGVHPALSSEAEEKLKRVFKGERISYDVELDKKNYTVSSVPLPSENGHINEIIVIITNITERKKTERELLKSIEKEKELNKMKAQFITMASHEFRTPLSTVLSSVFLLENYTGQELENNKAVHLGKIKRSVNNLTQLLNDFISLGKLEEGKVKLVYSGINIHEFLEELIPEMELVRKGTQTIRCEYFGEEREVLLDKQLLRSILLNLIGNAIKYSSIDAEIKLIATLTDNNLIINIIDQGIGIPKEEHKQIFKRFYRAHNATNIEGTGLGLNIVKKYARLMKGTIEFQSELNKGSTFTVTLPINTNA